MWMAAENRNGSWMAELQLAFFESVFQIRSILQSLAIFSFDTFFCWRGHTKTAVVRDLFQNPPSSLLEGEFWNRLLWDLFHNPPPMRRTLFGGGGIVEQVPYGSVSVSTRHGGGTLFSRKMWGLAGAFWNITNIWPLWFLWIFHWHWQIFESLKFLKCFRKIRFFT